MNTIPIPKKFSLFGEVHKVKLLKKVNRSKDWGFWDPQKNIISLEKSSSTRNQDQVEQVFLHEAVHAILDHLSYHELSSDEGFVDNLSKALHQLLKTAEY